MISHETQWDCNKEYNLFDQGIQQTLNNDGVPFTDMN